MLKARQVDRNAEGLLMRLGVVWKRGGAFGKLGTGRMNYLKNGDDSAPGQAAFLSGIERGWARTRRRKDVVI